MLIIRGDEMRDFKPDIYQNSIFDINYDKLYQKGIRCLLFDLDNTLGLYSEPTCSKEAKDLITKLKKKFTVVIVTNSGKRRITPYLEDLGVDGISWAFKPSCKSLVKIKAKYHLTKKEMIIIGDQLMTDILAGKKFKIMTAFVNPLGKRDLPVTGLNRFIENKIINKYSKKDDFERGKYYE